MRILSDADVCKVLSTLTRDSVIEYQAAMLASLANLRRNPAIIPPRTVQTSNTENSDSTHLFMPCVGPHEVGLKVITGGPSNTAAGLGFVGTVMVLDEYTGALQGVVNGKSLTAFRTALASSIAMRQVLDGRPRLPDLTVFGVGAQAYWHVRLAVLLYEFRRINVVNRTLEKAQEFARAIEAELGVEAVALAPGDVAAAAANSSVLFGCTPATEPIIQSSYINGDAHYVKFISLIGSYKPHMAELELDYVRSLAAAGTHIVVDSAEHAALEAGELIQTQFPTAQLTELADLTAASPVYSAANAVLCKLVGLSIMDVSMAKAILERAQCGAEIEF